MTELLLAYLLYEGNFISVNKAKFTWEIISGIWRNQKAFLSFCHKQPCGCGEMCSFTK